MFFIWKLALFIKMTFGKMTFGKLTFGKNNNWKNNINKKAFGITTFEKMTL